MLQLPSEDPWYRWALSVRELLYLNLDVPALGKRSANPAAASTSSSILPTTMQASRRARLGVVVHLHYLAVWPEIRDALRRLPSGSRVFLTISDGAVQSGQVTAQTVMAEMATERPDAFVQALSNLGRDVGPFMRLLAEGHFDDLDCVCKIHGKRSRRREGTLVGDTWRQYAIETLLPSAESIERIGRYFTANPQVGILGPARLRFPRYELGSALERDHGLLYKLMLSRFGGDVTEKIVFFAGTMFWFRPEALKLLRHPPTGGWAFAPEPTPEGSLAHALERLLPTSALLAGYSVESLPDTERIRPGLVSHVKPG
jgi:lipopolysaccharide biosynthesis protein